MITKLFRTTVTGSYPRPLQPGDTLRKPTLTRDQADEIIRCAVTDQVAAGLDVVTDGEERRNYDMMSLWQMWDFKGEFAVGVIDQRSDAVESPDEHRATHPARTRPFPTRTATAYVRVRIPACR